MTIDTATTETVTIDPSTRGPLRHFADVVPVAPDAALIDRLVAWNGRTPALVARV